MGCHATQLLAIALINSKKHEVRPAKPSHLQGLAVPLSTVKFLRESTSVIGRGT
jgi:hypothetical protein